MDDLQVYSGMLPDKWPAVGETYKVQIDPTEEGDDAPPPGGEQAGGDGQGEEHTLLGQMIHSGMPRRSCLSAGTLVTLRIRLASDTSTSVTSRTMLE